MKPIEVEDFLDLNGWRYHVVYNKWNHLSVPLLIDNANITKDPDGVFNLACDLMDYNKIAIKHTHASFAQSQAHKAPQQAVPVSQPAITFNANSTDMLRDYAKIDFYVTPKCDCGAVKCKTTHSHWCSTQVKGNQNGR